jgi:TetR/AcrR family transcriptional regulator, transcriptional repressor of bet genes
MPKIGMEPIRRMETINATLECIYEYGIDHITLDMVAAKAGFSKGIVSYYFKSKKNLIHEALKEFLMAYKLKINSDITKDMQPLEMINVIIDVALPPLEKKDQDTINVSTLGGANNIRLPQERIAKIFIQFVAKASIDVDLKKIMQETYRSDVEGISTLMEHVIQVNALGNIDEKKTAYTLFAMIYGLSFFRVNEFMPDQETDNREIAYDYIKKIFGEL